MAVHAPKSDNMIRILDDMTQSMYGRKWSESITADICVECGNSAAEFEDELSEQEYRISGLCQRCQNKVFRR